MPRNGSGTMSTPNSFTAGTSISSTSMNANFSDHATEITNSLPRDGQAGMTGQFKASSGTAAAPGMAWSSDTDTGFRRSAANTTMAVANGTDVAAISDVGITMQSGMDITDKNGTTVVGIPTGFSAPYFGSSAPTGWVLASGLTIGNASSSATGRANADTEDLFTLLWNSFANAQLAVSGGRGASAAADYAANKTIALPDLRGRSVFGLDTMGGSAASRVTSAGSGVDGATIGATGGAETHTLTSAQIAAHTHPGSVSITSSSNASTVENGGSGTVDVTSGSGNTLAKRSNVSPHTITSTGTVTVSANTGGGGAHNNMPPAFMANWIIKL